jgi:hypothetical protein
MVAKNLIENLAKKIIIFFQQGLVDFQGEAIVGSHSIGYRAKAIHRHNE